MEVHSVQLEMVCESIQMKETSITESNKGSFSKAANDRSTVNEDGLRDWNINLW